MAGVRNTLPESLFVDGENPLLALHRALSIGLHSQNDEECLALANAIRAVLTDFTRRARAALREDEEVKTALARLSQIGPPASPPESTAGQSEGTDSGVGASAIPESEDR